MFNNVNRPNHFSDEQHCFKQSQALFLINCFRPTNTLEIHKMVYKMHKIDATSSYYQSYAQNEIYTFRGHTFMTFTKKDKFCYPTPLPPYPLRKNEQFIYCLKIIESGNTWQISRLPFRVDFISVWFLTSINMLIFVRVYCNLPIWS